MPTNSASTNNDPQQSPSCPTQKSFSIFANLGGAGISALSVPLFFHPFDAGIKRWQIAKLNAKQAVTTPIVFKQVIFQDAYNKPLPYKILSLYRGIPYAMLNRFIQVGYITSCERIMMNKLRGSSIDLFYQQLFGKKHAEAILNSTAGIAIGTAGIIFLPIDILKVQMMANEKIYYTIKNDGIFHYCKQEKNNLYKASLFTIMKNSLAIALFLGTNTTVKYNLLPDNPTPQQKFSAYGAAAFVSTLLINPFDVIKTRTHSMTGSLTARTVFRNLRQTENWSVFFKGVIPKLFFRSTKLAATFGVADICAEKINSQKENAATPKKSPRPAF